LKVNAVALRDIVPVRANDGIGRPQIGVWLAVVVGVGTENSKRDAEAVAERLERDYGFQVDRLLDGEASAEAIERTIARHLDRAGGATQWLFYFAGHGWRTGGKGYLAAAGAREGDASTLLALAGLCKRCLSCRCGEILIVLDACHAGQALVRSEELDDRSSPEAAARQRIRQILCSASPEAPARDDGGEPGHSVFTQSLLDALDGRAGVHDENGCITFGSLRDWVVADVERRLQAALGTETRRQKPIGGHLAGNEEQRDFTFRAVLPRVPPGTVRALTGPSEPNRAQRAEHLRWRAPTVLLPGWHPAACAAGASPTTSAPGTGRGSSSVRAILVSRSFRESGIRWWSRNTACSSSRTPRWCAKSG
jgi:Caspase domain